jgi:protein-tyrosine phosphatase
MKARTVLFLCSGNYYRSRYAEGLFNHLAANHSLEWRAESGGLKIDVTRKVNVGPLSPLTLDAFRQRAIPFVEPLPFPKQVTFEDLNTASLVIALKEAEHRALMRKNFPDWEHRITYWHVHDLDVAPPEETLHEIDKLVRSLVDKLVAPKPEPAASGAA